MTLREQMNRAGRRGQSSRIREIPTDDPRLMVDVRSAQATPLRPIPDVPTHGPQGLAL